MQCHYEVLGITNHTATADEVKIAYHKLALKLHPDKSNASSAKEDFQRLQEAYTTLSDPQDRKWYDEHRNQILHGDQFTESMEVFNVYPYFRPGAYKGYSSDSNDTRGFYSIFTSVFKEIEAMEGTTTTTYPPFGNQRSNIKDVLLFYRIWGNFYSSKSFSWCDDNIIDLPANANRLTRRAVEKENKKRRKAGLKKYNAEIQSLVTFVKHRDRRWISYCHEKQALRQSTRRRNTTNTTTTLPSQEFPLINSKSVVKDETEAALEEFRKKLDFVTTFSCDLCQHKSFKTKQQLENHQKSKKHRAVAKRLGIAVIPPEGKSPKGKSKEKPVQAVVVVLDETPVKENFDNVKNDRKATVAAARRLRRKLARKEKQSISKPKNDYCCNICSTVFATRNKLFKHLEDDANHK